MHRSPNCTEALSQTDNQLADRPGGKTVSRGRESVGGGRWGAEWTRSGGWRRDLLAILSDGLPYLHTEQPPHSGDMKVRLTCPQKGGFQGCGKRQGRNQETWTLFPTLPLTDSALGSHMASLPESSPPRSHDT